MKGLLLHLQPCVPCRKTALQGERKAKTIICDGHSNKNYRIREKIQCLKEWPTTQQAGEFLLKESEMVTS